MQPQATSEAANRTQRPGRTFLRESGAPVCVTAAAVPNCCFAAPDQPATAHSAQESEGHSGRKSRLDPAFWQQGTSCRPSSSPSPIRSGRDRKWLRNLTWSCTFLTPGIQSSAPTDGPEKLEPGSGCGSHGAVDFACAVHARTDRLDHEECEFGSSSSPTPGRAFRQPRRPIRSRIDLFLSHTAASCELKWSSAKRGSWSICAFFVIGRWTNSGARGLAEGVLCASRLLARQLQAGSCPSP